MTGNNITSVIRGTSVSNEVAEATYQYDDHGQLILERNRAANACYGYTYDAYGNITEVKEGTYSGWPANTVKSFSYSGDRLVRYDGSRLDTMMSEIELFTYDDTAYAQLGGRTQAFIDNG